jgi:hypothetical protein
MIDTVLAVIVLFAVLLFGALLVAGNERQRKAIDALNTSYTRWAEHDLVIKRATAAKTVQVEDPQTWLEQIARQVFGVTPKIASLQPWQGNAAKAMLATCSDGRSLVVTPLPPADFRKMIALRPHKGAAAAINRTTVGPLGTHPGKVPCYELNIITAGTFFDVEARQAWEKVFNENLAVDRLYMFAVASERK